MHQFLTRRRVLALTAMALAGPSLAETPLHVATGQALGARVVLRLAHPEAALIAARAMSEIARLERVFSLYRPDSALVSLNTQGVLTDPPFELLELLTLAGSLHRASGGAFDPTVQPLWALHAETWAQGRAPQAAEIADARARVGWDKLRFDAKSVRLPRGMALTLNGIAQGYIADRVAEFLAGEGLERVLIDTGELVALGPQPDGRAWPVTLASGADSPLMRGALASSAPLGTCFDPAQTQGHILDPRSGAPVASVWRAVSVRAPSAALADGLSTAICLTKIKAEARALCDHYPDTTLAALVPA